MWSTWSADVSVDEGPHQGPAEVFTGTSSDPCLLLEALDEFWGGDQLYLPGRRRVCSDVGDARVGVEELYEVFGGELDPVPVLAVLRRSTKDADGEIYGLFPCGEEGQEGAVLDAEEADGDGAGVRPLGVVGDEHETGHRGRVCGRIHRAALAGVARRRCGRFGRGPSRGLARRSRSSCVPSASGPRTLPMPRPRSPRGPRSRSSARPRDPASFGLPCTGSSWPSASPFLLLDHSRAVKPAQRTPARRLRLERDPHDNILRNHA